MKTWQQWLESFVLLPTLENITSYDRATLNNLMGRLNQGGLLGKHIQISPQEVAEIINVTNAANSHLSNIIQKNPKLSNWFQQYKEWEKTHGVNLIRMTFPNSVVQNGGNIQNIQASDRNIVVPQELYHLLTWQEVGRSLRTFIKQIGQEGITNDQNHRWYGTESSDLKKSLWQIAQLFKI